MTQSWTRSEKTYTGTGTVSGVAGSLELTGVGTKWPHDMGTGFGLLVDTDDDGIFETVFTIGTIPSSTMIVVESAPAASFSGKNYQVAQSAYEPAFGQPGGMESDRCAACGLTFPKGELVYRGGLGYCRARGHDKEIEEIEQRSRREIKEAGFRLEIRR